MGNSVFSQESGHADAFTTIVRVKSDYAGIKFVFNELFEASKNGKNIRFATKWTEPNIMTEVINKNHIILTHRLSESEKSRHRSIKVQEVSLMLMWKWRKVFCDFSK